MLLDAQRTRAATGSCEQQLCHMHSLSDCSCWHQLSSALPAALTERTPDADAYGYGIQSRCLQAAHFISSVETSSFMFLTTCCVELGQATTT